AASSLIRVMLCSLSRSGLWRALVGLLRPGPCPHAGAGHWPANTPDDEKVEYDLATIKAWLRKFLIRFFQTAQFKRSALPNGPKVVTGGSLSPRGDWRAPSDGNARVWLDELDANVPD
ncbi:MAG: NAD(+) synthase, partial [Brevundimonas sp.]|nr:NAD(+) synthase [Brevundimonas sp.]